jgi:hypothetical protein
MPELAWTATQMRTETRIVINAELIAAYQAASSPHSIRALKSDLEAFDLWCRRMKRVALPATPEIVADYLDARAGQGPSPPRLDATRRRSPRSISCLISRIPPRLIS